MKDDGKNFEIETDEEYDEIKSIVGSYLTCSPGMMLEERLERLETYYRTKSAIETWQFRHGKEKELSVYVNTDNMEVTTHAGQKLGTITELGEIYKDSFGGNRQSIKFIGLNNLNYSGTYYISSTNLAKVALVGSKKKKKPKTIKKVKPTVDLDKVERFPDPRLIVPNPSQPQPPIQMPPIQIQGESNELDTVLE